MKPFLKPEIKGQNPDDLLSTFKVTMPKFQIGFTLLI